MTTITLPADLESRLAEEARRRGTTVEELAVERLRSSLPAMPVAANGGQVSGSRTMYDKLKDYIGILEGPVDASRDTTREYAEDLNREYERQQQEFLRRRGMP